MKEYYVLYPYCTVSEFIVQTAIASLGHSRVDLILVSLCFQVEAVIRTSNFFLNLFMTFKHLRLRTG